MGNIDFVSFKTYSHKANAEARQKRSKEMLVFVFCFCFYSVFTKSTAEMGHIVQIMRCLHVR